MASLVTSFTVGASGAVVSVTFAELGSEVLPSLSVAVTCSSSPPFRSTLDGISIV